MGMPMFLTNKRLFCEWSMKLVTSNSYPQQCYSGICKKKVMQHWQHTSKIIDHWVVVLRVSRPSVISQMKVCWGDWRKVMKQCNNTQWSFLFLVTALWSTYHWTLTMIVGRIHFCFEKEMKKDEEENERGRDRERRLRAANPKSFLRFCRTWTKRA